MALAAELRSLVASGGGAGRIIGAAQKEHGRVGASRQTRRRVPGDVDNIHHVRFMAGRADDHRVIVVVAGLNEYAIVGHEPAGVRASHADHAVRLRTIPIGGPTAVDSGTESDWMVAQVAPAAGVGVFDQGGNGVVGSIGRRQCLIDSVPHHGSLRIVAIVATQAGQHARHVRRCRRHTGRQNLDEFAPSGDDGLAVQAGDIFAPKSSSARSRIGAPGGSITGRAAVRRVAGGTAAAVIQVSA